MSYLAADRFFQTLRQISQERNLPFLLIGGHAVNLFGYSRDTHDIDLLIRRSELPQWREIVLESGYEIYREEHAFVQLTPAKPPAAWPLDFMLVNDGTFEKLYAASIERLENGVPFRVPAVEHLIALKLHVLKQDLRHRTIKDFQDVQGLVEHNKVDLNAPLIKGIFEQYGTPDLYERLRIACGQAPD